MQFQTDVFFFILYYFSKTLCVPFQQLWAFSHLEKTVVLKPPFTKCLGVHHYACSWQLQPEQGKKHQKGWWCEVWFWEKDPSILSVPSYFPEFGQKQIVRRKYVWDCVVLWLLLLAEAVVKTLVQKERVVCCKGKELHFMPLACLLPLLCSCTGETQQSWTRF